MLRALTIEEVSLVAGGMEEYADSESLDGGDGGGDFGGDGGDFGGDDGSYGDDSGGDGYAAAENSSSQSTAPAPSSAPSTSPAGTALDNLAAGGICLAGVGATFATDGIASVFVGAGTAAACLQAGRSISATIKP